MSFRVGYSFTAFVVIFTVSTIVPVIGQCTIEGCENGDSSMSIIEEIQQLNVQTFGQLNKQIQSVPGLLEASFQQMASQLIAVMRSQQESVIRSLGAVDKRLQEHDILIKEQIRNSRIIANVWDCSDIRASGQIASGVYEVCVGHQLNRVCTNAICDMTTTNGPWMVFQRRINGSVDFYRTRLEYKEGFGDRNGEFWLGNEVLYLLTSKRKYKLRVDLEDWDGAKRYAEYTRFSISSSADNYRLTVSGYSGDAGDGLTYHNGYVFSTRDMKDVNTCAGSLGGAWWYHTCYQSNLNGKYHRGNYSSSATQQEGIQWNPWRGHFYSLKSTEMKLVPMA